MNFKDWLLSEMPITKFQLAGQWGPEAKKYGYKQADINLLTNPRHVDSIHRKWSNTKFDFDFYFLRSFQGSKYLQQGEVTSTWVKEKLGLDIEPREDAITVVFTQNRSAEQIPMTAWMIAHRLSHAISREPNFDQYMAQELEKDFRGLLKDIYGVNRRPTTYGSYGGQSFSDNTFSNRDLRGLANAVGTMKSARQGTIRNFIEFTQELVAQWLITGKIEFNPLPKQYVKRKRMAWGRPNNEVGWSRAKPEEMEDADDLLQGYARKYEYYLDSVFQGITGKIFVM